MNPLDNVAEINVAINSELQRLMHRFGNLFLHVSGEGKVDFRSSVGEGHSWLGMLKAVISGDVGCMTPYPGYDVCALDTALDYLYGMDLFPHLNSSVNEEYVPSTEQWRKFVDGIRAELKQLPDDKYKAKYQYTYYADSDTDTPIVTVTLEPLCNTFVVGEYNAAGKHEYLGVIEDYDQPKVNHCWITVNGSTIDDIELKRVIHFRHRKFQPRKGDYLLYDAEADVYIILPQEDYSIH